MMMMIIEMTQFGDGDDNKTRQSDDEVDPAEYGIVGFNVPIDTL